MGKIKIPLVLIIFFVSWNTMAQVNRYMVFFTDKANTPHSISSPLTFLAQKAIDRRTTQNISITAEDLPVTPAYVQSIRDAGVKVLYKTKWFNAVLVECTESDANNLTSLPFVNSFEKVAPGGLPPVNGRIKSSSKFNSTSSTTATTDVQVSMLGMDKMHSDGLRGEGMLIAVMDSGFPGADTISYFKHVFSDGRFNGNASQDFVHGVSNVFNHDSHGTNTWSTISGYKQGIFEGGAYKASFVLFITEDASTEYRVEEYNWLFAAERADSVGVDVISTSLGYSTFDDATMNYSYANDMDGETTVITRASKIAASKGMAVVVSAGNEGNKPWHYITAPADASEVLAVGAVTASGTKSNFSSFGPSAIGRFKPDVAAMGSFVSIVNKNGSLGTGNGTSFAAPLMASFVTCYWQKLRDLPVQTLLDTVRRRGNQFNNPDNNLGFGIPTYYDNITAVEPVNETFVKVYPNPSSGEIILEFTGTKDADFEASLVDIKGETQLLFAEPLGQNKFRMNLSEQSAGMYALKIYRNGQISVHKILKTD